MRQSCVICLFFICSNSFSQNLTQTLLPNWNALATTFNISTDTLSGTSFAITNNNKEYLVTAKHLFKRAIHSKDSICVKINSNKIETLFKGQIFVHPNPLVDIAVLRLTKKISQKKTLILKGGDSYYLGQECLFLGYPLFNLGSYTQTEKIPLIKRAIISALYEENGLDYILLDGHNNPGFSGGPILTYGDNMNNQFIFGIISGYINELKEIKIKDLQTNLPQHSLTINENSGIIIAFPEKYIEEILKSIPK